MTNEPRRLVRRTSLIAVALLVAVLGSAAGQAPQSRQSSQAPRGRVAASIGPARSIAGTIDIHTHSSPDNVPRSIDAVDLVRLAKERGMRALVLKNHYESTASLAFVVRKLVPGIEVFGGIDLNLTVGGINPAAVEHMTHMTGGWGRVVWMSTFDSEHQVRTSGEKRPFVSVSRGGVLLPAVKEVVGIIAKHNLVLATGHVSPEEGLMLVAEGRRQGVRHIVITHAMSPLVGMSVAQMQQAAKQGAYIEFTYSSLLGAKPGNTIDQYVGAIRTVGPALCILSTDLGQATNPLHPDGMATFLTQLSAKGFSDHELDLMTKDNPATLLGLADK